MQILSAASSLNPGSDLWILPAPAESRWPQRIDWYLNYQIHRASSHRMPLKSEPLNELLAEIDWPLPDLQAAPKGPLLIVSDGHLPARWLIVLPHEGETPTWVQKAWQVWSGLGRPSFRVFLPTGLDQNAFAQFWRDHAKFEDFSVVLDQDPRVTLP